MTQHDDRVYLAQMPEAAREAQSYVAGINFDAFSFDRMRQRTVIYVIQIIGEAARRVSAEGKAALPAIPWPQIIGMRHKLVHDYLGIDYEEVWRTAGDDLPALIRSLETALHEEPTCIPLCLGRARARPVGAPERTGMRSGYLATRKRRCVTPDELGTSGPPAPVPRWSAVRQPPAACSCRPMLQEPSRGFVRRSKCGT